MKSIIELRLLPVKPLLNTFNCSLALVRVLLASASLCYTAMAAPPTAVPGQILVQPKPGLNETALEAIFAQNQTVEIDSIPAINVRILRVPEHAKSRVLAALNRNPNIEFAEPDLVLAPELLPDDPDYIYQWHLPKIASEAAWRQNTGSASVIIAILDTGVNGYHPDLASNMVPGWNFFDDNSDTRDVHGHGTAVAGTAAASGNNGAGVASVAWNSKIMPIRVSDPNGYGSFSAMAKGLSFAADNGARVANISYRVSTSAAVTSAAKYFQSRGGVVTVAAGNQGEFDSTPDNPHVLTISATNPNDALTSWSNSGNLIDLAAPGSGIYTTLRNGSYGKKSGTSFSAPVVAGVAALVISANPSLNAQEIEYVLKSSADDLGTAGWDPKYGHGRVNSQRAVELALAFVKDKTAPLVEILSPADQSTLSGEVPIEIAALDEDSVVLIELYLNGTFVASTPKNPAVIAWDTSLYSDGAYALIAKAYDPSGNVGASAPVHVQIQNQNGTTITPPAPPQVAITSPNHEEIVSKNVKIEVVAESETAIHLIQLFLNGEFFGSTSASKATFNWNTRHYPNGYYTLEAVAIDILGHSAASEPVTVRKR